MPGQLVRDSSPSGSTTVLEHAKRAEQFLYEGNHADAAMAASEALALDRHDAHAYMLRARALCACKQYSLAINDCTLAIRLNYGVRAYALRAVCLLQSNQPEQAAADLERAKRLDSRYRISLEELRSRLAQK